MFALLPGELNSQSGLETVQREYILVIYAAFYQKLYILKNTRKFYLYSSML